MLTTMLEFVMECIGTFLAIVWLIGWELFVNWPTSPKNPQK